ncbi:MAG: hypothetical protein L0227_19900 [Chloroflexi bacterium]|nr:hypothetical protein [Chloroflexota bacterium]
METIGVRRRVARLLVLAALCATRPVAAGQTIGWDADDFLVAEFFGGVIAVFDSDFSFKGLLDDDFSDVAGLDLAPDGSLVAVSQQETVRRYTADGSMIGEFTHPEVGQGAIDISVSARPRLYIGLRESSEGMSEFELDGTFLRKYINPITPYRGVAAVPGNGVWAGDVNEGVPIDVWSIPAETRTEIPLDNGQFAAGQSFAYSQLTQTVLMTDVSLGLTQVVERTLGGTFVRLFAEALNIDLLGVTRGPTNAVFATECPNGLIFSWEADGTPLGFFDPPDLGACPVGIVWAGEPGFSVFADGFESGDTSAWSATVP